MRIATLSSFLVITSLVGCGGVMGQGKPKGPPPELQDPDGAADCHSWYKGWKDLLAQCDAYRTAEVEQLSEHYDAAEAALARSGPFKDTAFGKQFAEDLAIRKSGKNPNRVPLTIDVAKVKAIEIALRWDKPICARTRHEILVKATMDDGSVKETWVDPSKKKGFLDYSLFTITSPHGTIAADPVEETWAFLADANPISALDGYILQAALADRPEVKSEITVASSLECMAHGLFLVGKRGAAGVANAAGYDGGDAPPATVEVGVIATKAYPELLVMRGVAGDNTVWYVAPYDAKAKVEVRNQGGPGGEGAHNTEDDGYAGGNGGAGGALEVRYDKRRPALAKIIVASAPGGEGGYGGTGKPDNGARGQTGKAGPAPTVKAADPKTLFQGDGLTLLK